MQFASTSPPLILPAASDSCQDGGSVGTEACVQVSAFAIEAILLPAPFNPRSRSSSSRVHLRRRAFNGVELLR
jgi:hypothetical protein